LSSFFFHQGDDDSEFIAPAPPEYAAFTQERAVWQAVGRRKSEMTAKEFYLAALFLRLEARKKQS
jgi:hypothetical protein